MAGKAGIAADVLHEEFPRLDSIPFELELQYMSSLHDQGLERPRLLEAKGSAEAILARCEAACDAGGHAAPLDREAVLADLTRLAADGLLMPAFASRELPPGTAAVGHADVAGRLFLGLQAMIDPPRAEAVEAVATCQAAYIRVKMITGDHALTAAAIAARLGLDGTTAAAGALVAAVTGKTAARGCRKCVGPPPSPLGIPEAVAVVLSLCARRVRQAGGAIGRSPSSPSQRTSKGNCDDHEVTAGQRERRRSARHSTTVRPQPHTVAMAGSGTVVTLTDVAAACEAQPGFPPATA